MVTLLADVLVMAMAGYTNWLVGRYPAIDPAAPVPVKCRKTRLLHPLGN